MNYSIVIPTYQRPENLALILERLAEGVTRRIHVLILTEPNSNSLPIAHQFASWSDKLDVEVIVNVCKAGVDESILRAYEQCNSEWIFFLGDSKLPAENFETLLKFAHETCPEAVAYFFTYDSTLSRDLQIRSIKSLVESGFTLGDFILGGNSVFSRKIVEKYITHSYRTLSSRIAHVAMPLMALSRGDCLFISNRRIIEKFLEKPSSYQPGKALLDCWASFSLLVLLPIDRSDATLLNKYIVGNEKFYQTINFYKYCLLMIFREKLEISKDLKCVLNLRYIYCSRFIDKTVIRLLYSLAFLIEVLRGK